MPHGGDVEAAAELDVLGQMGQVDIEHNQVGDTLVAFRLEVVLGHPHGIEAIGVQGFRDGLGLSVDGHQVFVVEFPVVDCGAAVADVGHVYVTGEQAVELGNHLLLSLPVLIFANNAGVI